MVRTFGERPANSLIALYGTEHDLMVSVVNGNATQRLRAKVGDVVEVDGR
jgi:S-adenosylmethionine hydrolase